MFAWLAIGFACLVGSGCASSNVNPPAAARHTGYVDFYAEETNLCWQVFRVSNNKTNEVFSDFDPLSEHILRLAYAPGHYQFNVNLLNRVIVQQGNVDVEVKDGMITPVYVVLADSGSSQVRTREAAMGRTSRYYGGHGMNVSTEFNQAMMYRVELEVQEAIPYQTKTNTPYATGP
jgi:hypothetical protein